MPPLNNLLDHVHCKLMISKIKRPKWHEPTIYLQAWGQGVRCRDEIWMTEEQIGLLAGEGLESETFQKGVPSR